MEKGKRKYIKLKIEKITSEYRARFESFAVPSFEPPP